MTIIDYYFNRSGMGSFEFTICKAWVLAGHANRLKLENAFPDHFPLARMYGIKDFREFAYQEQLESHLAGSLVMMNEWGHKVEAVHLPWERIKQRGFQLHDRAFGTYIDNNTGEEIPCLCFRDPDHSGNNLWYVTEEKLEDLMAQESNSEIPNNHK